MCACTMEKSQIVLFGTFDPCEVFKFNILTNKRTVCEKGHTVLLFVKVFYNKNFTLMKSSQGKNS